MPTYLIKEIEFVHSGEYYVTEDIVDNSQMYQSFSTLDEALKVYKTLIVSGFLENSFESYDVYHGMKSEDVYQAIEEFISPFMEGDYSLLKIDDTLLNKLNDDEIYKFAHTCQILRYKIEEATTNKTVLYSFWLTREDKYFEIYEGITHQTEYQDLRADDDSYYFLEKLSKYKIKGIISDISHNPQKLVEIINSVTFINYDESINTIEITASHYCDIEKLHEFNTLLKEPLYQIHTN